MPVDRVLGNLATVIGDIGAASGHYRAAIALCERAGYRPQLAMTLFDQATLHAGNQDPNDLVAANQDFNKSLALAHDLGMKPLIERILRRRQILTA